MGALIIKLNIKVQDIRKSGKGWYLRFGVWLFGNSYEGIEDDRQSAPKLFDIHRLGFNPGKWGHDWKEVWEVSLLCFGTAAFGYWNIFMR